MNRLEQSSFSFSIFRSGQGAFQQMHSGEATCFYGKSLHSAGQPSYYCQDGQIDCTRIPIYPTFFWLKLKLNRARVTAYTGIHGTEATDVWCLAEKKCRKIRGMERHGKTTSSTCRCCLMFQKISRSYTHNQSIYIHFLVLQIQLFAYTKTSCDVSCLWQYL